MAKNVKADDGHRNGAVKGRSQVYNPVTGNYVKRDASSGKFIDVKSDGKAFKGIRREARITKVGAFVSKSVAKKAEQSVIKTLNKRAK